MAISPLLPIVLLQAGLSLLLLHNTAFQDEALYVHAGTALLRWLTGGPRPSTNYATYFSGYPYFYPLLAGVLNQVGGLVTVRLFSMVCMLVTTTCVHSVTRQLYNQVGGYAAAALFALAGPTLFLTQFATYDALSLVMFALATVVAFRVSKARMPVGAPVVAVLLALAVAAKYAALIFVPFVIGILAVRTFEQRGWKRALLHVSLAVAALALIAVGVYRVISPDVLAGVSLTTTQRQAIIPSPPSYLLGIIVSLGGLIWLLSLLGLIFTADRVQLTAMMLLIASLAAPIYHLHSGESVSLHKHVDFGLFFAAPVAGYAVAATTSRAAIPRRWLRRALVVSLCLVMFASGIANGLWWYGGWPNSEQMIAALRPQLGDGRTRCLCQDLELVEYYLDGVAADRLLTGPSFFIYTDTRGVRSTGLPAYESAVEAGYFDVIELNVPGGNLSNMIGPLVTTQPQYQLVAKLPNTDSYGQGYYMIWKKVSP